ncbi:hypothetical protein RY27_30090 [Litorilinea aerophila]|nr:hypothetical protein RY27_30090 [Litorilinea aerophila]
MEGVHFGHGGLAPPDWPQAEGYGAGQRGHQVAAAIVPAEEAAGQPEEQAQGGRRGQGAEQVHSPGPVAQGEQHPAPEASQQDVEGVARRVGDAEGRPHQLEFQAIVEQFYDTRRRRGPVEEEPPQADEPTPHPLLAQGCQQLLGFHRGEVYHNPAQNPDGTAPHPPEAVDFVDTPVIWYHTGPIHSGQNRIAPTSGAYGVSGLITIWIIESNRLHMFSWPAPWVG